MSSRQPDLFLSDEQPELFEDKPAPAVSAKPEEVRAELLKILAEARAAQTWPQKQLRFYQTVFPQMSRWLPEGEAAQLCLAFETELQRLKAA